MLFDESIEPIDEEKQALGTGAKSCGRSESSIEEKSVDSFKESASTRNMELEEADKVKLENFGAILDAHDPSLAAKRNMTTKEYNMPIYLRKDITIQALKETQRQLPGFELPEPPKKFCDPGFDPD